MLGRPFVGGQQAGRGTIGQRRGIAGRQRALARRLVERRLQRRQFLDAGVGAQNVVARHAAETHHQVVEETALVGGGQLVVRGDRQLVLRFARDVPLARHVLAVLAHRLAGARFGHAGEIRLEFTQRKALERRKFLAERLGRRGLQQTPAQGLAVHDRHVRSGVRAATDANLDLPGRDLAGDVDDRVQRRAARALQGDAGRQRRQAGTQCGLAAQVPVRRMLDHRAHRHFAELLPVQAELLDQRAQRAHRHAEVAHIGIRRVLPAERDADAAKNGDRTTMQHRTPRGCTRCAGIMDECSAAALSDNSIPA